ncbi:MAG: glycosyltransferase family 2 protein, partial [Coriobacteriia bacterium]|nr:glycosyltransferase family 2 protein [Coriobacteriia bacterium]
ICSADDVLLPLHLATMAQSIDQHPGYDILSCNGYYWHADGVRQIVYPPRIGAVSESWSLEDVLRACFFSVGACYRRDLFDTVGGYPEGAFGEDYIFWMRAMAHGAKHLYVSEALALHRISATQKSADLRASYESDIESIASVMSSGQLSVEQMRVARAAIWHRRRMIFGLRPFGGLALRLLRLLRSGLQDARSR